MPCDLDDPAAQDEQRGPGPSLLVDSFAVPVASLVRASGTERPEAYDGVTGIMTIAENNGQGIRAAFKLRNYLYFVKERSLYVTATDGVNEPALWQSGSPGVMSMPLRARMWRTASRVSARSGRVSRPSKWRWRSA